MPEMLQISCDCPCYIGPKGTSFEGFYHMSFSKLPLVQLLCGIVSNNQLLVDDCLEKKEGAKAMVHVNAPPGPRLWVQLSNWL